jgi:hypothetical protein
MAQQTFEELVAAVKQAESRGKRFAADGKTLTTSPKGALGEMQVMPKTITDPGFGVAPARDKSPDEIARVGVDYLQAMKQKYGDTEKALIAYNWGPGSTDKWIASGADPKKLPEETRTYVQRVKGFLGKDVSRETMAKKEREPLPESLPPMAKADQAQPAPAPTKTAMAKVDVKSMPASYQAAFALAALADAQDEEDDKAFNENKQTETETFFASYKPVNHLASLDLSVTPVMMADGGEVTERKDEPIFDAASRTFVDVMTGRRTPITERDFTAKEQMAMMDAVKKSQARGGKGRVDYQDYPSGDQIGPGFVDIRNTLGGFQYKQTPDGATVITDRYDFHGPRAAEYEKMGTGEKVLKSAKNALSAFVKSGGGVRDAAGELGDAWIGSKGPQVNIRIPVKRADGGDAEPTAEEIAAASKPATVNPNIRKQGEAARKLAAMRDVNTLPDPKTYAVTSGLLGTRPDQMGFSVMNPKYKEIMDVADPAFAAGTALQVAPALQALGLGKVPGVVGGELNRRLLSGQSLTPGYNTPAPINFAMKPKGGHYYVWPESSAAPEKSQVDAYLQMIENRMESPNAAVADWIKSKVGRYIRSDFATEQDQMVKAAEEGKKLHFTTPRAMEESAPIIDPSVTIMRQTEGFPAQGFAKTEQGKMVEDIVDSSVWPATLDNTPSDYIPSSIRGLKDTDPNMRIYEFPDAVFEDNMRITDLANKMDKMMTEKTIKLWNQEVPVPKEYQLDTDTLKGLTPAQASNRVAMKEEWLAKKEPELAGQALTKDPQLVSHRYDNGSKWISPADLSENDMHRQMVNSIGCRGGWCTDKDSFAIDYGSGDNRLHILLDKGFQPRAQLTMSDRQGSLSEFLAVKVAEDPNYNSDLFENLQNARSSGNQQAVYNAMEEFSRLPEYLDWSRKNNIKQITEIKGQFNKEDITNQPYLKEVQDFVKRQGPELQSVENLDGIGMTDISSHIYPNKAFKAISTPGKKGMKDVYEEAIKINGNSAYIENDPAAIDSVIEKAVKNVFTPKLNEARTIQMNLFQPPAEKAYGGMIERQPNDNRRYL